MNSKRSMWKLLVGVASVGLLVTNCTIKTDDDDAKAGSGNSSAGAGNATSGECSPVGKKLSGCICAGNLTSYQLCTDEGIYGACVCDDTSGGGASSYGGAASYAGNAGAVESAGSAGADASEGGADSVVEAAEAECYGCFIQNCTDEWDACAAESETTTTDPDGHYCLSEGATAAPGQIEAIMTCIANERKSGLVKRDIVRACGSSIGASADPMFFEWPPANGAMTPATEGLINCMADAPDETIPGNWANASNNFPSSGPRPWDDMTCAKTSCTAAIK
ncbi:MAG: hypothetical protein ABUL62_30185 [Myxococcales bacterium]|jgi:hypothetical protein